ncbi:MAG: MaoC family dehydratase [Rhodospirillales bacterium]|nr:MAG: MaoC family dehydratase [Rhodospirillales bacterium]
MSGKSGGAAERFDPRNHTFGPAHYFEDLEVGRKFYINSRTQTDALFSAFQLASGDNHPIHYDRVYCQARGHRDMLAHGLQVAIQAAPGAGTFPHILGDAMIGFIEQSSRFLKPVYAGDTLYPMLEITELRAGRTTGVVVVKVTIHNEGGDLVMDGEQKFLVRKRPAGAGAR